MPILEDTVIADGKINCVIKLDAMYARYEAGKATAGDTLTTAIAVARAEGCYALPGVYLTPDFLEQVALEDWQAWAEDVVDRHAPSQAERYLEGARGALYQVLAGGDISPRLRAKARRDMGVILNLILEIRF